MSCIVLFALSGMCGFFGGVHVGHCFCCWFLSCVVVSVVCRYFFMPRWGMYRYASVVCISVFAHIVSVLIARSFGVGFCFFLRGSSGFSWFSMFVFLLWVFWMIW